MNSPWQENVDPGPSTAIDALVRESLAGLTADLRQQEASLGARMEQLRLDLTTLAETIVGSVAAPAAPQPVAVQVPPTVGPPPDGDLDQLVFGPDFAEHGPVASARAALIAGFYNREAAATALVGQMLVFQAATVESMPGLLKDVGEAYYAWHPHSGAGDDAMRDALVQWLLGRCQAAGVGNTIQLVTPGDRYDSKQHHARERGIEVEQVFGWIVLRDNGKVYTKASVTLR